MNTEPSSQNASLTRRDALVRAFKGTAAAAVATPLVSQAAPAPLPAPEFVPENDYPFFGGDVPEGY